MKMRFIIMGVFMLSHAQACEKTHLVIDEASVELLVTPINLGTLHKGPSMDPIIALFEGALYEPFYQGVISSIKKDLNNTILSVEAFKKSKKKSQSTQKASDKHVAGYVKQIERVCKIFQLTLKKYDYNTKNLLNMDCVLGGYYYLNDLVKTMSGSLDNPKSSLQAIFKDFNRLQSILQNSLCIKVFPQPFLEKILEDVNKVLSCYDTEEVSARKLEFETLFRTYQEQYNFTFSSNLLVNSIRKEQLHYAFCRGFHELMMRVALAEKPFLKAQDLERFVDWGFAMATHQENTILQSLCTSQNRSLFKIELQDIQSLEKLQMVLKSLKRSKIIDEQEAKNEKTKEAESSSGDTDSTIIMEDLEDPSPKTDGMQRASETSDAAKAEMTNEQIKSVDSYAQNLEEDSKLEEDDVNVNPTTQRTPERALVPSPREKGDQRSTTVPTSLTDKLSSKMHKLIDKLGNSKLYKMGCKESLQVLAKLGITIKTQNGGSHDKMTNGRSIVRGHGGDKKNKLSWLSAKLLKKLLAERINTENTDLTTVKEQKNQIKNAKKTEKK
jgi:hypothetical protein